MTTRRIPWSGVILTVLLEAGEDLSIRDIAWRSILPFKTARHTIHAMSADGLVRRTLVDREERFRCAQAKPASTLSIVDNA